jgi:hypothetical protein
MTTLPNRLILQYLYDVGVLVTPEAVGRDNWPAVAGKIPAGGDRYVGIMNTGARLQGRVHGTGEYVRTPTFQVMVRAEDDATAGSLCEDVVAAFSKVGTLSDAGWGRVPVFVGTEVWALESVLLRGAPFPVGLEQDRDLYLYSINAELTAVRVTPDNVDYLYPLGGYG